MAARIGARLTRGYRRGLYPPPPPPPPPAPRAGSGGSISAQALPAALHAGGSPIGLATVYRTLADLAAIGEADSLQSPDGEALYRACSSGEHHHHLICRHCGRTVEIGAAEVESWAQGVAAENGFVDAAHVVDIFGWCAQCADEASGVEDASSARRAPGAADATGAV